MYINKCEGDMHMSNCVMTIICYRFKRTTVIPSFGKCILVSLWIELPEKYGETDHLFSQVAIKYYL
jgi:hypothetical protein